MYREVGYHGIRVFKDDLYNIDELETKILCESVQYGIDELVSKLFVKNDKIQSKLSPLNNDDIEYINNMIKTYNIKFMNDNMDIVMTHQELNKTISVVSVVDFSLNEQYTLKIYKKDDVVIAENNNMRCPLTESISSTKNKIKRSFRKFDTKFDNWYSTYKKKKEQDERDKLMRTMPKPSKILKDGLAIGGLSIINPVLGLSAVLIKIATSKKSSVKAKHNALREIRAELEIIEEEIRDAESEGDKDKKKELMRARRTLNDAIVRIKIGDAVTTN